MAGRQSIPANRAEGSSLRRKRQWGTEKRFGGSRVIPLIPGRATISAARFAIFFTLAAWVAYIIEQVVRLENTGVTWRRLGEAGVYFILMTLLTASACAYLMSRIGYFERARVHRRLPRSAIDDQFEDGAPVLSVIIPSYREEERVVRQTLLSTALQEYPGMRITLLVDDPPYSPNPAHRAALERTRALPKEIMALLGEPHQRFAAALDAFEQGLGGRALTAIADASTLNTLAAEYDAAANWCRAERLRIDRVDHTDEFYDIEVVGRLQSDFAATADAIRTAAVEAEAEISLRRVRQLYLRLVRTFDVQVDTFERKQFASLSHEPNKAMNLNSYLGLMGGKFTIAQSQDGRVLVPATDGEATFVVPNPDYVVTLDADSMLMPEYCLRLVHYMEQPSNGDVAVAQTPYSAYRGAYTRIERIAGATTDIQHIVHQGLTYHNATFWVGANAVIRKKALDQLEETDDEGGFIIKRYIKDRTVIEDTESSIDLRALGWRLYNYPERLSYSATPPDFGSLVIQRQRWANGGLVILPGLLRLMRGKRDSVRPSWGEFFLRLNYLASISWASLGLLILLFYPFEGELLSRFAVLTAIPYFWTMSSDLRREGYHRSDIFRIYGFNLLLLPVNMAGTIQSLIQGIGGQKIAFMRTPKVNNRTVVPLLFLAFPVVLIAWSLRTLMIDIDQRNYIHGSFAAANFFMTSYATIAFIGIPSMLVDLSVGVRGFIYRPVDPRKRAPQQPHWASVIYYGNSVPEEVMKGAALAASLAAKDASAERRAVAQQEADR